MTIRRTVPVVTATLALSFAFPLTARTDDNAKEAPQDIIVNFGDPVWPAPPIRSWFPRT